MHSYDPAPPYVRAPTLSTRPSALTASRNPMEHIGTTHTRLMNMMPPPMTRSLSGTAAQTTRFHVPVAPAGRSGRASMDHVAPPAPDVAVSQSRRVYRPRTLSLDQGQQPTFQIRSQTHTNSSTRPRTRKPSIVADDPVRTSSRNHGPPRHADSLMPGGRSSRRHEATPAPPTIRKRTLSFENLSLPRLFRTNSSSKSRSASNPVPQAREADWSVQFDLVMNDYATSLSSLWSGNTPSFSDDYLDSYFKAIGSTLMMLDIAPSEISTSVSATRARHKLEPMYELLRWYTDRVTMDESTATTLLTQTMQHFDDMVHAVRRRIKQYVPSKHVHTGKSRSHGTGKHKTPAVPSPERSRPLLNSRFRRPPQSDASQYPSRYHDMGSTRSQVTLVGGANGSTDALSSETTTATPVKKSSYYPLDGPPYRLVPVLDLFSNGLLKTLEDLARPLEEEAEVKWSRHGLLLSASISQMVRILTDEREIGRENLSELADIFFLFFRSFCASPSVLFDLLLKRYFETAPQDVTKEQMKVWHVGQQCTKVHVVNMFSIWLEYYWAPATDDSLLRPIRSFMFETVAKDTTLPEDLAHLVAVPLWECAVGLNIVHNRWLDRVVKASGCVVGARDPTGFEDRVQQIEDLLDKQQVDWIDAAYFRTKGGPEMLAQQLTGIETEFFHALLPEQFVRLSAPETKTACDIWKGFSNALTLLVARCVVIHRKVQHRVEVMEMFIAVAAECKRLRNYSSALAIVSGLRMAPISRLLLTQKHVRMETTKLFHDMSNYFLTDNNWREYREAVRQNLPAVPLLPVIIRDVAQCREALERVPSMIGPPVSGPIPLPYYRNLRRTVRDLEACYGAHNVQRVDLVHYWLMKQTESLRDETYDRYSQYLMELSLRQEPRIDHH